MLHLALEVSPEEVGDDRRHRHWSEPVQIPIQEHGEHQQTDDHQRARHGHTQVRHEVAPDPAHQREGEGERSDEQRQQDLEHAVAVPEAHVASGERAGGHLDDERRHGHDESGQGGRCPDDCREDRDRRRGGVLQLGRQVRALIDHDLAGTEHGAEHRAGERQHPEAVSDVEARTKGPSPVHAHSPSLSRAHIRA